jgi:hypothetical protein
MGKLGFQAKTPQSRLAPLSDSFCLLGIAFGGHCATFGYRRPRPDTQRADHCATGPTDTRKLLKSGHEWESWDFGRKTHRTDLHRSRTRFARWGHGLAAIVPHLCSAHPGQTRSGPITAQRCQTTRGNFKNQATDGKFWFLAKNPQNRLAPLPDSFCSLGTWFGGHCATFEFRMPRPDAQRADHCATVPADTRKFHNPSLNVDSVNDVCVHVSTI